MTNFLLLPRSLGKLYTVNNKLACMSSSQFMWHGKRVASMLTASAVYNIIINIYSSRLSRLLVECDAMHTFMYALVGTGPLSKEEGGQPQCHEWGLGTHTLCFLKFLLCYAPIPNSKPIVLIVVYLYIILLILSISNIFHTNLR